MRAIVIIVIAAALGYFGYQYSVNGRDPQAVVAGTGASGPAQIAPAQTAPETRVAATVDDNGTMTAGDTAAMDADTPLSMLLTPSGFNADAVIDRIDRSDLSVVQKSALTTAVNAARDDAALLPATLTRLREAMGL